MIIIRVENPSYFFRKSKSIKINRLCIKNLDINVDWIVKKFSIKSFKGRVQCFSMQVVINKCFLPNPEKKIGTDPSCCFREKRTFNSEN